MSHGKEETALPVSKQDIIPGSPIPYTLIRSRRKTISIRILPSGEVEAPAPPYAHPEGLWEKFIYEKSEWIRLNIQRNQELYRQKKKKPGIISQADPLSWSTASCAGGRVSFSRGVFYLPRKPLGELLPLLQGVYKEQAAAYLPSRTEYWAEKTGLYPEEFRWVPQKEAGAPARGKIPFVFPAGLWPPHPRP